MITCFAHSLFFFNFFIFLEGGGGGGGGGSTLASGYPSWAWHDLRVWSPTKYNGRATPNY